MYTVLRGAAFLCAQRRPPAGSHGRLITGVASRLTALQCPKRPSDLWRRKISQRHVRFTPESGLLQRTSACPLWANSGHATYSITSSARPINVLGMLTPSDLAVFRLMYISTFVVACWIGRSPG